MVEMAPAAMVDFNIGRHYRFSGGNPGVDRYVWFQVDVSNYESIDFEVIRGNWSNGGERPDSNEHLYFQYWTGSAWSTIGSILASDSSFDKLKDIFNCPITDRKKYEWWLCIHQSGTI